MWGYSTNELAWSPTGRYLAVGGGPAVTVWDCSGEGPAGTEPTYLEAHVDFVGAFVYQRVGPLVASTGIEASLGRVEVYGRCAARGREEEQKG